MKENVAVLAESVKWDDRDIHDFERVGDILRRMKLGCESEMTDRFDPALSLRLDMIEAYGQMIREEGQP